MPGLTFDSDTESVSYHRASETGALIRPYGRFRYLVSLNDTDERRYHVSTLSKDIHGPRGKCSCHGWKFHREPCAHLWTLWLADQDGIVELAEVSHVLDQRNAPTCPICNRELNPEVAPATYDD